MSLSFLSSLEVYMIVNFKTRKINQSTCKLARIPKLIKKKLKIIK